MTYEEAKINMGLEMNRLKDYFPFRIVWGAILPDGTYEVGANATKHRVNNLMRKGYSGFII